MLPPARRRGHTRSIDRSATRYSTRRSESPWHERRSRSMSVEVSIPELGESITEAVIAAWLKSDRDVVAVDEPICELETDKANTEMPAPASGVLQIVKAEGETVQVGDVIARIEEGSRAAVAPRAVTPGARSPRIAPAARRVAEELGIDPAEVSPTGAGDRVTKQDLLIHAKG
ncbi:MAG: hypothetical protein E4H03_13425, partial [Myxococcales bacterium]